MKIKDVQVIKHYILNTDIMSDDGVSILSKKGTTVVVNKVTDSYRKYPVEVMPVTGDNRGDVFWVSESELSEIVSKEGADND